MPEYIKQAIYLPQRFIICGDFNEIVDHSLDSSNSRRKSSYALSSLLFREDLYNIWRCAHGTERDYTCFSPTQGSYFRLDLFLTSKLLLQQVTSAHIGLITWFDHAPVTISLNTAYASKSNTTWRMNASLLTHTVYKSQIGAGIESYFSV